MLAALLIPLYALADRFTGGGWPKIDAVLPGRSLFWAALVCAGAGFLLEGLAGALLAVVWAVYRSLPWKALGGRTDPREATEIPGVLARHAIVVPFVTLIGWRLLGDGVIAAAASVAYAIAATALAFWYGAAMAEREGDGHPEGDENTYVELARGAAYGVMVAALLAYT